MAKAPAKKKGASRNSRSASSRQGVPGWLWLALGLAIGLFTAFLWHLWEINKDGHRRPTMAGTVTPAASDKDAGSDKAAAEKPASKEPRFEFYTLLPSQQVMSGKQGTNPGKTTPSSPSAPAADATAYLLQAGSFKSEAEADRRRATILLLGLPVKVVKVPVKPGETWYRVVVGPFTGKTAAQSARASLRSNGVDTLVIKQG